MGLVLQPSFDEKSRAEIEAHVEEVRTRRMVAAIEYHEGQTLKLEHENDKVQRKIKSQYEMLGKELARFDKLDEAITHRMVVIEALRQEYDLNTAMIVTNSMED